jgi:hypothetical protein
LTGVLNHLDITRPVLVVTGRVSLDEIDYQRIPADAYIFREGQLETEDHYWFGRELAAWFVPARAGSLTSALRTVYRGGYKIGALLTDLSRGKLVTELGFDSLDDDFHLEDWNDYLVGSPATARLLTTPHSPSIATVMIATALGLGFTDVILLDGQTSLEHLRKVQQSPLAEDPIGATLRSRSRIANSYELGQLSELKQAFPKATITDGGATAPLTQFLKHATKAPGTHLLPAAKQSPGTSNLLYRTRSTPHGERRCAYVTYFDDDGYFWGAVALANSLARVSEYPLIALTPSTYRIPDVQVLPPNMVLMHAPRIRNMLFDKSHQDRFKFTYSKLGVFALTFLNRAIYLDADTIVLQNVDDLFDRDGFCAAPDFGLALRATTFNSGVFGFTPSAEVFQDLIYENGKLESYDGGDQGFLNTYFDEVDWLDSSYNTLWRMLESNPGVTDISAIRVLHYVGPKPWDSSTTTIPPWLMSLWLDRLGGDYIAQHSLWEYRQKNTLPKRAAKSSTATAPDEARSNKDTPSRSWKEPRRLALSGKLDAADTLVKAHLRRWPNSVQALRTKAIIQRKRHDRKGWARTNLKIATLFMKKLVGRK